MCCLSCQLSCLISYWEGIGNDELLIQSLIYSGVISLSDVYIMSLPTTCMREIGIKEAVLLSRETEHSEHSELRRRT